MNAGTSISWPLTAILIVFAAVTGIYVSAGPQFAGDSMRYLDGADQLLATGTITGKAASYRGYIAFVAVVKALVPDPALQKWTIVALQALIQAVALLCLYSLGKTLFSERAGLIAAGLFAVNFYSLRWTPYILTESLFVSFVVITCWFCVKSPKSPAYFLPAVAAAAFTATLRPNGIAMLPAFVIFFLLASKGPARLVLLAAVAAVVLLSTTTIVRGLDETASHEDLVNRMERGTVVYGTQAIEMPKLSARSGSQLRDFAAYLTTYPRHSLELFASRLYAAWSWQRSDYSARHRLFLAVVMPAIYLGACIGLAAAVRRRFNAGHALLLLLILAQSAVIAVSFASHDHRFIGYIMPLVLLFAANGASATLERFSRDPST